MDTRRLATGSDGEDQNVETQISGLEKALKTLRGIREAGQVVGCKQKQPKDFVPECTVLRLHNRRGKPERVKVMSATLDRRNASWRLLVRPTEADASKTRELVVSTSKFYWVEG